MAKHPFAAQARQMMEESGIVFNTDGTTSVRVEETTTQETQVEQPSVETTVGGNEQQTGQASQTEEKTVDERDTILELQRKELEQLRQEKAAWEVNQSTQEPQTKSDREADLERELASLRDQIKNQTESQQADAFRQMLEQQGFDSENLDDDVLLEIRDRFVKPMAGKLERLEERLAQYDHKLREPTPEERLDQVKQETNKKIVEAIPDFQTIFKSQAFKDKLSAKDSRFPTKTYGQTMQIAYESGDHEFIVREVKNFLNGGTAPDINAVADVGASNGVGTNIEPSTEGEKFAYTNEEAIQMLRKRQMGDLSKQEYSEYRAKLDAYRSRT